jgi:uncharacterized protein (UPF0303 family)
MSTLDQFLKDEEVLSEAPWTHDLALSFGQQIVDKAQKENLVVAVAIFFNNQRIFQVGLNGTSATNDEWIMRKVNTVQLTQHSSLALRKKVEELGIQEDALGFHAGHLAVCGGGYPLKNKGQLLGIAIVSGLPHEVDHSLIVDSLIEFRKGKSW